MGHFTTDFNTHAETTVLILEEGTAQELMCDHSFKKAVSTDDDTEPRLSSPSDLLLKAMQRQWGDKCRANT